MADQKLMEKIVSLCKRRGIIFPSSEIYGGFANSYTYGPLGSEIKKNIKDLWWQRFVRNREDMVGIDGPILLHPKTWEASGHVAGFNDQLVDCKNCRARLRADHIVESALNIDCEGLSDEDVTKLISENDIQCPKCGKKEFTDVRKFNLMFSTEMAKTGEDSTAYLRPETAQAIFLEYKNVVDSTRVKLPFGIGQIGKSFRNEITPGNFIFRVIEFEQMEIEYFIREEEWKEHFEKWFDEMKKWCTDIGLPAENCHEYEHAKEKLSHYSKRTVDIEFDFPFGKKELYGLAYRTDFDLSQHEKFSGQKLRWRDEGGEPFIPHVLEPTFGVDRSVLAAICAAYTEEKLEDGSERVVLKMKPVVAPVKVAVFPLMKKDGMPEKAREIIQQLRSFGAVQYDDGGAIGKRYRRHDEIGTPVCVTVDYDTLEDDTVTIRDRDTMKQERIKISELISVLSERYFL
jgi:glycyl-tRNA synthetase